MYNHGVYYISQNDECQTNLKQFQMMIDEENLEHDWTIYWDQDQNLPLTDDGPKSYVGIIAVVISMAAITVVALLGWFYYAYRKPTSSSGQFLIRFTSGNQLFRFPSTSTV